MTDSARIAKLLEEMSGCEVRITEIKSELATLLLGVAPSKNGGKSPVVAKRRDKPPRSPSRKHGVVAKGRKGRKVLEIIYRQGGQARAGKVAEMLGGGPKKEVSKSVRAFFYHLSRGGNNYLEKAGEHGVWKLTLEGYEAIGRKPHPPASSSAEITQEAGASLSDTGGDVP